MLAPIEDQARGRALGPRCPRARARGRRVQPLGARRGLPRQIWLSLRLGVSKALCGGFLRALPRSRVFSSPWSSGYRSSPTRVHLIRRGSTGSMTMQISMTSSAWSLRALGSLQTFARRAGRPPLSWPTLNCRETNAGSSPPHWPLRNRAPLPRP